MLLPQPLSSFFLQYVAGGCNLVVTRYRDQNSLDEAEQILTSLARWAACCHLLKHLAKRVLQLLYGEFKSRENVGRPVGRRRQYGACSVCPLPRSLATESMVYLLWLLELKFKIELKLNILESFAELAPNFI